LLRRDHLRNPRKKKKGIHFSGDTKEDTDKKTAYPKTPNVLSRKADHLMTLAVTKDKCGTPEDPEIIFKPRTSKGSSALPSPTSPPSTASSSSKPNPFLPSLNDPTSGKDKKQDSKTATTFTFVKSYESPDSTAESKNSYRQKQWAMTEEDDDITSKPRLERRHSASSVETMTPAEKARRIVKNIEWKQTLEEKFNHHTPWFSTRSVTVRRDKPTKGLLKKTTNAPKEVKLFQRLQEKKQDRLAKMIEGAPLFLIDQFLCKPHLRFFSVSEDGGELCWEKDWETKLQQKTGIRFESRKKRRSLATVVRIVYGPFRKWMVQKNPTLRHCIPWLCFTLEFAPEYEDIKLPELLGFVCKNEEELDIWLTGLSEHSPASRLTYLPYPRLLWRRLKLKLAHGPKKSDAYVPTKKKWRFWGSSCDNQNQENSEK